jgi:hypothetical protein
MHGRPLRGRPFLTYLTPLESTKPLQTRVWQSGGEEGIGSASLRALARCLRHRLFALRPTERVLTQSQGG